MVLCDEAHTALGEKTAAAIRALDTPTYIGMTATDQLLQKHVGDVFPAEVADFPLADAVKSGVVAPLRAVRVRPGASLRRVRIVGGDFDQQELAQALDHDALNMAAAMYYQHMFGNKPGIVYSAGVDHAERVAAAMRVVGLKAAAVSGRTPPRELAFTLAAYERGEINVLVNAQLLAEGWNAPRATVCMHLAPTASKRVYQQRIGRIMRLHRRKEAGVVVDFTEATAPHTDRTVTVHSLLGVDVYHPGALVTPRSPRRRQRWRRLAKPLVREAGWLVPVTADPLKRREIILRDWKQIAIDRLPVDEQGMWAENAGRRVGQKDLQKLAKVLTSVSDETRMLFFATCAAENKHRQLRLIALGDLAQNRPTANVFERAVRLVEAAPTWRLDRAQGSRTLLLALGDRRVEASDHQMVAWAWRLARASRDAQFRHLTSAHESGRDVARALAGKSGDDVVRAAKGIAAMALDSPLDLGAALLAVVQTTDLGASRILEDARDRLSGDAAMLAAALGANIPLPRAPRRPQQPAKRPAQQRPRARPPPSRPSRPRPTARRPPPTAARPRASRRSASAVAAAAAAVARVPAPTRRRRSQAVARGAGAEAAAGRTSERRRTTPGPKPAPRRPRRPAEAVAAAPDAAPRTSRSAPGARRPSRSRRRPEVAPPPPADVRARLAAKPRRPRRPEGRARRVTLRPGPARPGWDGLPGPRRRPRRGRRDHRAAGARHPARVRDQRPGLGPQPTTPSGSGRSASPSPPTSSSPAPGRPPSWSPRSAPAPGCSRSARRAWVDRARAGGLDAGRRLPRGRGAVAGRRLDVRLPGAGDVHARHPRRRRVLRLEPRRDVPDRRRPVAGRGRADRRRRVRHRHARALRGQAGDRHVPRGAAAAGRRLAT